jgi:acyl-CoA synthetase (AMP-forming)/AMP-acid ligase II
VVPRPGAEVEADEVVAFTRASLAHYKCPRQVFVRAELPRNPMGKVQKFRVVEELTAS